MKNLFRIVIYIFGLCIITIGINLSIVSGLGISPVSAFTVPLSQLIKISLGTVTTACYVVFVVVQYLILGKRFKKKNLLQSPFSMVFGIFVDMTGSWMVNIVPDTYTEKLTVLIISILVCAIGATLYIAMDIVSNAPEGLQLSFCERFKIPFSRVKMISDCLFVFVGFCISIFFLNGVTAIREGTVLSALLTGKLIGVFAKKLNPVLYRVAFNKDAKVASIQ